MRSANHSAPLKGFRPYNALLGLNQASGLAGGPDFPTTLHLISKFKHKETLVMIILLFSIEEYVILNDLQPTFHIVNDAGILLFFVAFYIYFCYNN